MDLSAIIVIVLLTALFFGSIVWLEIYSRRKAKESISEENGQT